MKELDEHIQVLQNTVNEKQINEVVDIIVKCFKSGNKVLFCGNGGSAADAQHMAGEFVCKMANVRAPLPSIALSTDTSILTAIGNDFGFNKVFSRQVDALGQEGDVLIALSTSGSENIIEAVIAARLKGLCTIGFTGEKGRKRMRMNHNTVVVKSDNTARIQEAHEFLLHVICQKVEDVYFK